MRVHVEEALGELVTRGFVTADAFSGLRALVTPASRRRGFRGRRARRGPSFDAAGRWALLGPPPGAAGGEVRRAAKEHAASAILRRYGVVCRVVLERERQLPAWRELRDIYRSWEARGEIRGGRFVDALGGEQFALTEAVQTLRGVRRATQSDEWIVLSAVDPLNLAGVLTPGGRITAVHGHRLVYRDGVAVATLAGGALEWLEPLDAANRRRAQSLLSASRSAAPRAARGKSRVGPLRPVP